MARFTPVSRSHQVPPVMYPVWDPLMLEVSRPWPPILLPHLGICHHQVISIAIIKINSLGRILPKIIISFEVAHPDQKNSQSSTTWKSLKGREFLLQESIRNWSFLRITIEMDIAVQDWRKHFRNWSGRKKSKVQKGNYLPAFINCHCCVTLRAKMTMRGSILPLLNLPMHQWCHQLFTLLSSSGWGEVASSPIRVAGKKNCQVYWSQEKKHLKRGEPSAEPDFFSTH